MNQRAIIEEFEKLSLAEKAEVLDVLWAAYQQGEEKAEFSDEELAELDRRMAAYDADPSTARPAEEVHRELRARLGEA